MRPLTVHTRLLVFWLIAALGLPTPALALRTPQAEAPTRRISLGAALQPLVSDELERSGLEEGQRLGDVVKLGTVPVIAPPEVLQRAPQADTILLTLDAGKGTRFEMSWRQAGWPGDPLPKQIALVGGLPCGWWTKQAAEALGWPVIAVVGYRREEVMAAYNTHTKRDLVYVVSENPAGGTGYAFYHGAAVPGLKDSSTLIVAISGDRPLFDRPVLEAVEHRARETGADLVITTARFSNPKGKGRIVRERGTGRVLGILEQRDIEGGATLGGYSRDELLAISEGNVSVYAMPANRFFPVLAELRNDNAQQQFYVTDLVKLVLDRGGVVETVEIPAEKAPDLTTVEDLATVERSPAKLLDSATGLEEPTAEALTRRFREEAGKLGLPFDEQTLVYLWIGERLGGRAVQQCLAASRPSLGLVKGPLPAFLPLETSSGQFGAATFRAILAHPQVRGVIMATPYKTTTVALAADLGIELEGPAADLQALSFLQKISEGDGRTRWVGNAFDGEAFVQAYQEVLPWETFARKQIVLFGAGGAGRAILVALANDGRWPASVTVVEPDATARATLEAVRARFERHGTTMFVVDRLSEDWAAGDAEMVRTIEVLKNAEVLINATPLGKRDEESPLRRAELIPRGAYAFDLNWWGPNWQPRPRTRFLEEMARRGVHVFNGLRMATWLNTTHMMRWFGGGDDAALFKNVYRAMYVDAVAAGFGEAYMDEATVAAAEILAQGQVFEFGLRKLFVRQTKEGLQIALPMDDSAYISPTRDPKVIPIVYSHPGIVPDHVRTKEIGSQTPAECVDEFVLLQQPDAVFLDARVAAEAPEAWRPATWASIPFIIVELGRRPPLLSGDLEWLVEGTRRLYQAGQIPTPSLVVRRLTYAQVLGEWYVLIQA